MACRENTRGGWPSKTPQRRALIGSRAKHTVALSLGIRREMHHETSRPSFRGRRRPGSKLFLNSEPLDQLVSPAECGRRDGDACRSIAAQEAAAGTGVHRERFDSAD